MLRDKLHSGTRAHHDRLERGLDIPDSIRDRSDYARLLGRLYGFYAPLEAQLLGFEAPLEQHGVQLRPRLKTQKLELDLHTLGWTQDAISRLPSCSDLPRLAAEAHALGCLYVLEGSTLGGQIIARRLERALQLEGGAGLHFFRAYGERTGRMWQALVEGLNACPAADAQAEQALHGARETFAAMERWLLNRGSQSVLNP